MKKTGAVLPDASPLKMTLLNQVLWILQLLERGAAEEDDVAARFGDAEKANALLFFMKETGLTAPSKEGNRTVISPAGRQLLAQHDL